MKNKLLVCFFLCAVLLLGLGAFACAESDDYVLDDTELLTEEQLEDIYIKASAVSERFNCGVYIIFVNDYTEYGEDSIALFSAYVFNELELGLGTDRNAIVLAISVKDRDFDLASHGQYANSTFTDNGKQVLIDSFMPDFENDDWLACFSSYIAGCEQVMSAPADSKPDDAIAEDRAQSDEYVFDDTGLLTQEQLDALSVKAAGVSERFNCGVYIVCVNDYTEYGDRSIAFFSEDVFNELALGLGTDRNGIVLAMSMSERDFDLAAHGQFANSAFTDYGKQVLQGYFLPDFRNNDWYKGFDHYIDGCEYLMSEAVNGKPVDVIIYDDGRVQYPDDGGRSFGQWMMIIFLPIVIAGITCGAFASQMKTAKLRTEAREYLSDKNIRIATEHFTHSTVTRTKIEKSNDSGGHSGGTTVNSGGFSHSSGKF